MGLKAQLAFVAAVSLLLPWAGCEYVRETELALRQNQQTLLRSAARGIAAGIAETSASVVQPDNASTGQLYLKRLSKRPVLDGFGNEWTPEVPAIKALQGSSRARFSTAEFDGLVYLLMVAGRRGTTIFGVSATDASGKNRSYLFEADAPGPLIANLRDATEGPRTEPRVRGFRTETSNGPYVEIQIPVELARRGLGLFIESGSGDRLATSFDSALPPAPIRHSVALQDVIDRYRQPGVRLHVVDTAGWIRAGSGTLAVPAPDEEADESSMLARFYRRMLRNIGNTQMLQSVATGRDTNRYVKKALRGNETDIWLRTGGPRDEGAIVAAAVPIRHRNSINGAVVMNQNSASLLFLTNAALTRLATLTLAVILVTVLILLSYATWLSFRIRRLSQAADDAMDSAGALRTGLPSGRANDEIGSLSRSFSTLLTRVADYNAYLRALSGRLSHELRTPMAVVSSSLDNLESGTLTADQREYATRARDGIARLRRLVHAMSEATRVEQAAADATMIEFDLGAILTTAVDAYRDVYPAHKFRYLGNIDTSPMIGAPDLLVQLTDKLIDNAVSFTAPGGEIIVALDAADRGYRLSVTNPGPLLPESMQGRLFDSLVSVRESDGTSHMGFGLYIARLIAEAHGGTLTARNLEDNSGVSFIIELPRQPATGASRRSSGIRKKTR